jgi:hypothetical protein
MNATHSFSSEDLGRELQSFLSIQGIPADASSIYSPGLLLSLLDSPFPEPRKIAVRVLRGLMQDEDPCTRWGVIYCLLRIPFNLYLTTFLSELQDKDQADPIRKSANTLLRSRYLKTAFSPFSLMLVYSKVHFLFYLAADLTIKSPNDPEQ